MPWFPDFVAAAELVRRRARTAAQADPVARYFSALADGDVRDLEAVWPGQVVIFDPRAGEVRGHRRLRQFVHQNQAWLAERAATTRNVASTCDGGRAVVEVVARLTHDGQQVSWPLAVVAESADDRSMVFRTYCSQWPVDGRRHVRAPILTPGPLHLPELAARYRDALADGDVDTIVGTFAPGGYVRDSTVPAADHRGPSELRSFFAASFASGGGVVLEPCAVTDDGVRCAVEYDCARWGSHDLPPQAGIVVLERDPVTQLLAAVRMYDDIEPPTGL